MGASWAEGAKELASWRSPLPGSVHRAVPQLPIPLLRALAIGLLLAAMPLQAAAVLRVGVADGSQPCSFRKQGSWSGMAVELWQRIADQERLPYVLVARESTASLLEATRRGELDVAIGCITVSPERLGSNRFSLPFQETGLGVMTLRSRLDLGVSLLQSLLTTHKVLVVAVSAPTTGTLRRFQPR